MSVCMCDETSSLTCPGSYDAVPALHNHLLHRALNHVCRLTARPALSACTPEYQQQDGVVFCFFVCVVLCRQVLRHVVHLFAPGGGSGGGAGGGLSGGAANKQECIS